VVFLYKKEPWGKRIVARQGGGRKMRNTLKKLAAVLLFLIMPLSLISPALASPSSNHARITDLETMVRTYVEQHVDQFLDDGGIMDNTRVAFEAFVAELALSNVRRIVSELDDETLLDFAVPLISAMLNDVINSSLARISSRTPNVDVSAVVSRVLTGRVGSRILESLLHSPLVNDILERAVEYAVADALDYAMSQIVFIPGEADVLELSRRYAREIADVTVLPFPLTNAFLNANLVEQGLLLAGHSRDLVNPFWTIEIHAHGFLDLQRTYRVTGWQRTVNTNSLEVLENLIPDLHFNVNDLLSIENYVLVRLGVDVVAGTYDGITNFDVDSFMEALPDMIWAATQRATAHVMVERAD